MVLYAYIYGMNATINDICLKLKELREVKNVSLLILADLCEIDKSTLSKYERGVKTPKLDTLEKWANALGRTVTIGLHQPIVEVES